MSEESKITINHDQLMNAHTKWAVEESDAASDAGRRRKEMGDFQEKTGVHKKALSHIRAGLKLKKEGDRLDWLRSMEIMLPMVADHIRGQGTQEMSFDEESEEYDPGEMSEEEIDEIADEMDDVFDEEEEAA
jgi:hypothetical protein